MIIADPDLENTKTVFCTISAPSESPSFYHPQIQIPTEVARECREVKIVLNHFRGPLGVGPYKRNDVFPQ